MAKINYIIYKMFWVTVPIIKLDDIKNNKNNKKIPEKTLQTDHDIQWIAMQGWKPLAYKKSPNSVG